MDMDDVISTCLILMHQRRKMKELFDIAALDAVTTLMEPFPEGNQTVSCLPIHA